MKERIYVTYQIHWYKMEDKLKKNRVLGSLSFLYGLIACAMSCHISVQPKVEGIRQLPPINK